jgi:3-isopropylmalate/(R)-2-methylmalate dehydratase large subunit
MHDLHNDIRTRHWISSAADGTVGTRVFPEDSAMAARTLYDKLVDAHVVRNLDESGLVLLYVDRTVLNEYTSPQAFAGLRAAGRKVWNPGAALMVVDHVNPTAARRTRAMAEGAAARQVD